MFYNTAHNAFLIRFIAIKVARLALVSSYKSLVAAHCVLPAAGLHSCYQLYHLQTEMDLETDPRFDWWMQLKAILDSMINNLFFRLIFCFGNVRWGYFSGTVSPFTDRTSDFCWKVRLKLNVVVFFFHQPLFFCPLIVKRVLWRDILLVVFFILLDSINMTGQSIMFPVTDPSSCEDQWPRSRIVYLVRETWLIDY